eukprot:TRINITY_DN46298_c0_g1_i1.p1 TRINITY_DN46298_c0_g1~~TRINITY_DN46298_c0_g1_i1.p1  ORF type:complete len:194 (+),score=57.95 TRINITY_DN46298_c0_g1_i1:143-724(+)
MCIRDRVSTQSTGIRRPTMEDDASTAISTLDACLSDVEAQLRPLFSKPVKELSAGLPPLESAKLQVVGAFAINTLFYIFLKTQGVDPSDHPVKQELDRVKSYFKKIREASAPAARDTQNTQLNVGAASRFIAAALGPDGSGVREQAEATETEGSSSKKKRKAPAVEEDAPEADKKKSMEVDSTLKKKKKKKSK